MIEEMRSKRGFTLVEVLVVIAVTVLLSSVLIIYGGTGRRQTGVILEQASISQVILKAKSLAISTFNLPPIPCGYGIFLDYANRAYILVRYSESGKLIDPSDPASKTFCETMKDGLVPDEIIPLSNETHVLAQGVRFSADPTGLIEYAFFVPPEPKTLIFLNGQVEPIASGVGEIQLFTEDGSTMRAIHLTFAGQLTFP